MSKVIPPDKDDFVGSQRNMVKYMTTTKLFIPTFQRDFVWKKEEIVDLLDGLKYKFFHHQYLYLGTIIVSDARGLGGDIILDGQQRIMTICILLKYLEHCSDSQLNYNIQLNNNEFITRTKPNNREIVDFLKSKNSWEEKFSFADIFKDWVTNLEDKKVELKAWLISNVYITWLSVPNNDDAKWECFEQINSKGKPLEMHELCSGFLISKFFDKFKVLSEKINYIKKQIVDASDKFGTSKNLISDNTFYSSFVLQHPNVGSKQIYKEFTKLFISNESDNMSFLKKLTRYAEQIIDVYEFLMKNKAYEFEYLAHIGFHLHFPLLARLYAKYKNTNQEWYKEQIINVFKYDFFRHLTGLGKESAPSQFVYPLLKILNNKNYGESTMFLEYQNLILKNMDNIHSKKNEIFKRNDFLESTLVTLNQNKINEIEYDSNNSRRIFGFFVLIFGLKYRNFDLKKQKISVEHINPQKPVSSFGWQIKNKMDELLINNNSLVNLAILSKTRNSSLNNKDVVEKISTIKKGGEFFPIQQLGELVMMNFKGTTSENIKDNISSYKKQLVEKVEIAMKKNPDLFSFRVLTKKDKFNYKNLEDLIKELYSESGGIKNLYRIPNTLEYVFIGKNSSKGKKAETPQRFAVPKDVVVWWKEHTDIKLKIYSYEETEENETLIYTFSNFEEGWKKSTFKKNGQKNLKTFHIKSLEFNSLNKRIHSKNHSYLIEKSEVFVSKFNKIKNNYS